MKKSQAPARTRNEPATTQIVTNLPIVQEGAATGLVAKSYANYRERFGRPDVPGILKCFATHPPLLEQMIELASSLLFVDGHLSRVTKEMIATYVSAINACPYCLDSHASFLRQQGGSNELVSALFQGDIESSSINTKERRLLNFVAKVSGESYRISPADIQLLQDAGWQQQQIAEAVHVAALFAYFNRVANAFGLPSQHLFESDSNQPAKESM